MIAQFPSEVANRIYDLIDDVKDTLLTPQGQLLFGDQRRIGATPTLCVEPGEVVRVLGGVPSRTENTLLCYLLLYYAKVDSNQQTRRDALTTAEAIGRYLDSNLTLARNNDGGIVIHGYVTAIDPGYSLKGEASTLMHAVRMTWTGKSKTILGA